MYVSTQSLERRRLLVSIDVSIQMMMSFGIFILTFIGIVIALIKISQKNNHLENTLTSTRGYF